MMADNGNNNDVFVYMGGNQRVPRDVTHAIVDLSVDTIRANAFFKCRQLVSLEMHDGVKIIEEQAIQFCTSLRTIKLPGVKVIERDAFGGCTALEDVEFGIKLEAIGSNAFCRCHSLQNIKIPKVRVIECAAFANCVQMTDVELSEDLERIGNAAFCSCPLLRRIALPLKCVISEYYVFYGCALSRVDLVGGIHKTVSSLLLESWRDEMNEEIDSINRDLPNTFLKTRTIRRWMERVLERTKYYKLKEDTSLLELAVWKAKLHEEEGEEFSLSSDLCVSLEKKMTFLELTRWKAKVDEEFADARHARHEARVTCGANIIIPRVLSFLNDDVFPTLNHNS